LSLKNPAHHTFVAEECKRYLFENLSKTS